MPRGRTAGPARHVLGADDLSQPPRDGLAAAAHPRRGRPVLAEGAHHRLHQDPAHRAAARLRREDQGGEHKTSFFGGGRETREMME